MARVERLCEVHGCMRKHRAKGYCASHYNLYRAGRLDSAIVKAVELKRISKTKSDDGLTQEELALKQANDKERRDRDRIRDVKKSGSVKKNPGFIIEDPFSIPNSAKTKLSRPFLPVLKKVNFEDMGKIGSSDPTTLEEEIIKYIEKNSDKKPSTATEVVDKSSDLIPAPHSWESEQHPTKPAKDKCSNVGSPAEISAKNDELNSKISKLLLISTGRKCILPHCDNPEYLYANGFCASCGIAVNSVTWGLIKDYYHRGGRCRRGDSMSAQYHSLLCKQDYLECEVSTFKERPITAAFRAIKHGEEYILPDIVVSEEEVEEMEVIAEPKKAITEPKSEVPNLEELTNVIDELNKIVEFFKGVFNKYIEELPPTVCVVEHCTDSVFDRGLCLSHYKDILQPLPNKTKCGIEGCNGTLYKKRLCKKHFDLLND